MKIIQDGEEGFREKNHSETYSLVVIFLANVFLQILRPTSCLIILQYLATLENLAPFEVKFDHTKENADYCQFKYGHIAH